MPRIEQDIIKKKQKDYVWAQVGSIFSFLLVGSLLTSLVLYKLTGQISGYMYTFMLIFMMFSMFTEGIDSIVEARRLKKHITLLKILKELKEENND